MAALPAAEYALLTVDGDGTAVGVALDAFYMDQYEVTNRAYRDCIEAGGCKWPLQTHSATRRDYFTDPAFDRYPVVHVTQQMAFDFCGWKGARLPSVQEWQAAASVSPITGQFFPFPWGASFDRQRANSASGGFADTLTVGSFRPGGDSPAGISDMAGNVAEWTATVVETPAGRTEAIVKGGSFASSDAALLVSAQEFVDINSGYEQIGFRCARN
jgi:iron(II)-dependent oxidoreductase